MTLTLSLTIADDIAPAVVGAYCRRLGIPVPSPLDTRAIAACVTADLAAMALGYTEEQRVVVQDPAVSAALQSAHAGMAVLIDEQAAKLEAEPALVEAATPPTEV